MDIRRATDDDNLILSEITKKSKAYWNYSDEQIENWTDALTISKKYIAENEAYKLLIENKTVGYYSLVKGNDNVVILDNMFVLPEHIGNGYGTILMNDFFERMKQANTRKVILEAEPKAEMFYAKFGFSVIGKIESSIKNRFLPVMEINLE